LTRALFQLSYLIRNNNVPQIRASGVGRFP